MPTYPSRLSICYSVGDDPRVFHGYELRSDCSADPVILDSTGAIVAGAKPVPCPVKVEISNPSTGGGGGGGTVTVPISHSTNVCVRMASGEIWDVEQERTTVDGVTTVKYWDTASASYVTVDEVLHAGCCGCQDLI